MKISKFFIFLIVFILIFGLNPRVLIRAQEEMRLSGEQELQIPEDIKGVVPDSDFIDSFCYSLKWRSIEMYNTFDAAAGIFEQAKNKATEIGITLTLPDVAALRNEADQKINAVCTATTIDDALAAMKDFMNFAQGRIRQSFESLKGAIEGPMKEKANQLRQKMENQMKEQQPQIESGIQEMMAEEQAKIQQEITSMIQEGKISAKDAQELIRQKIQERTEELIKQLVPTTTSTTPEISREALEKSPEFKKFMEVGDFFKNMGKEFIHAKKIKNLRAEEFKRLALEKRKELTFKVIDKKIDEAIEELEDSKDDIKEARKMNSQIPSADDIVNELKKDVKGLKVKLSEAIEKGDEDRFEKLMNDFRDKWENKRKEMQQKQSAKSVCILVIEKVKDARSRIENAIKQLTGGRDSCKKREDIEQCHKFNLHLDLVDSLQQKLNQILSLINEAENLCEVADENNPPGQIINLLNNLRKQGTEAEILKEEFNNLIK